MVTPDNWTLISQSFNSSSDTLIDVGIESGGCCFDDFRITCDALNEIDQLNQQPIQVFPSISPERFNIESEVAFHQRAKYEDSQLLNISLKQ